MKTMWLMKWGSGVFVLLRNFPAFGTGTFLRVLILSFFLMPHPVITYTVHWMLKKQIICQLCNVQYHSQWPFRFFPTPHPTIFNISWLIWNTKRPTYCNIGIGLSLFWSTVVPGIGLSLIWSTVVPALNCHPFATRVVVCQDRWPCRRGIFKGATLLNACYV